ncbi:MAG: dipeptide epimerase [Thermosediminibacteraceae bacterium]|nr:dipeptide epimerase [Thermosediminibacteraceae bacterium]
MRTKIIKIETGIIKVPLKKTFRTALRVATEVEDAVVKITTDDGLVGIGEAAPTAVITGETLGSILEAIEKYIKPAITGMDILDFDELMLKLHRCILKNTSAKAACDMAIYDILAQYYGKPLYEFLGGYRNSVKTDITISLNDVDTMVADALAAVNDGFDNLKIKVGGDFKKDIERVRAIRDSVGKNVKIRLDANQGWKPKEAIYAISQLAKYDIELVEQPVAAHDLEGLKMVTENSPVPIMADESVFTPEDAVKIISMRAADMINIKLMKCGGIHNALKINAMAEAAGMECMVGSMIESPISVAAAAHLGAACHNITRFDLDAAYLLGEIPVEGGIVYRGPEIFFTGGAGLGIGKIKDEYYLPENQNI